MAARVLRGVIAGADLGGTKLRIVVDGRIVLDAPTGPGIRPAELERLISASLPAGTTALGLAIPGLVDVDTVVRSDVLPEIGGWKPLAALGLPGVVVNDARAALAADVADLPADATAGVVMVGTGIGSSLLVHGRVLEGVGGHAGEFGSIPVEPDGTTLDMRASGAAILLAFGGSAAELHARLAAGDADARRLVEAAGSALGRGLAGLVNLFNPARLTLGGGTLRYAGYVDAARAAAQAGSLGELWRMCELREAADPDTLVARGAALSASRSTRR
ncbi:MAG: ROK family protein [Rhodospirillales bacterium]|nr:ROK family protein [Rhodospirillales bacterium]